MGRNKMTTESFGNRKLQCRCSNFGATTLMSRCLMASIILTMLLTSLLLLLLLLFVIMMTTTRLLLVVATFLQFLQLVLLLEATVLLLSVSRMLAILPTLMATPFSTIQSLINYSKTFLTMIRLQPIRLQCNSYYLQSS